MGIELTLDEKLRVVYKTYPLSGPRNYFRKPVGSLICRAFSARIGSAQVNDGRIGKLFAHGYSEKTAFRGKTHDNVRTNHARDNRAWTYLDS